jgi:DNA topoisomerase-1
MLSRSTSKLYCCCWLLLMLSLGQRCLVSAFSPRIARTLSHQPVGRQWLQQTPPNFQRQYIVRSATAAPSQKALVVFGPPDFDKTAKKPKRPFKLVIVESPSKCATISKILQQYVQDNGLGHDYVVTSCMGHVRNLSRQKTHKNQTIAGIDIEHRYQPTYVILPGKERLVDDMQDLSNKAQQLVLATDDDREGEAMAWHLLDLLNTKNGTTVDSQELPPSRVRFTEITPKAILESIQNPSTSLADSLVQAQETRRILDRLAGYTVSPLLWKKISPGLSAGRVQSVGMALIVQRERQRLLFQESDYWDIEAELHASQQQFTGQLVARNGQTIVSGGGDFEPQLANTLTEASKHKLHLQQEAAQELVHRLQAEDWLWTVANITSSQRKSNSPPPFITSTLQQEANKRLALSVSRVMQTAQQLYEHGYISYMRTDSNHLSEDAQKAIRSEIVNHYGGPDFYQPRTNKPKKATKKKGGKDGKEEANKPEPQAAHEAIRPSIQPDGGFAKPSELPNTFDGAAKELYELIYQRTVASHMPPQVSNQTSIRILGEYEDESVLFRTSGSVIILPGYTVVYPQKTEKDSPTLPALKEGQRLDCNELTPLGHITQPPARYTEASFVQELESLGVGRPSTYAGVIQILRDRAYVGSPVSSGDAAPRRGGSAKVVSGTAISAQRAAGGEDFTGAGNARGPLVPSLSAFVVTSLLEKHCPTYVDPSFTARMEERLDEIANSEVGQDERVAYLDEFYAGDEGLAAQIERVDKLVSADEARRAHLPALAHIASPNGSAGEDVGLFIGPWGPYIQKVEANGAADDSAEKKKPLTASLPSGMAADLSTITRDILNAILASKEENGTILGPHPEDGRNIRLKLGRFGAYLQWGEDGEEGTTTHTVPRSIGNMRNIDAEKAKEDGFSLNAMLGISLEVAIQYANLPRTVCTFNDLPIVASIGPYGPYLKYNSTYMSVNKNDGDVLSIDAETAEALVTEGIINRKSSKCRDARLFNLQ